MTFLMATTGAAGIRGRLGQLMKGWGGKSPARVCCLQPNTPGGMGTEPIAGHSGKEELLHDKCSSPRVTSLSPCLWRCTGRATASEVPPAVAGDSLARKDIPAASRGENSSSFPDVSAKPKEKCANAQRAELKSR